MTTENKKILKEFLNKWIQGYRTNIARPPLATLTELVDIYNGNQTTTINSGVIAVCDKLNIPYKSQGIGWKII